MQVLLKLAYVSSEAVELGCWFSTNSAISDDQLQRLPPERALPETDFPSSANRGVRFPGDVQAIEERLALIWKSDPAAGRLAFLPRLANLAEKAGVRERLPLRMAELLRA